MSGGFSMGGLISGLDSNTIISQLMSIERQPLTRVQQRIDTLESQRSAISSLRTTLQTLRNKVQDFRLGRIFDKYTTSSSEEKVATASVNGTPATGSYLVTVNKLASSTIAVSNISIGNTINPTASLLTSGLGTDVTAGDFTINGVAFTVDPNSQSLNTILNQINSSAAGVTATYDAVTDKVTFENTDAGNTSLINFGGEDDTSNFLSVLNVDKATQSTGVNGSTVVSSTRNLGAVNPGADLSGVTFRNGAVTAGNFRINGVSITVDPATDSLSDVIARINASGAQVSASYDSANDTIRVASKVLGSRTISFTSGTSNFLEMTNLTTATQTAGSDAEFTIDNGPALTRNSNKVTDAIGGITLDLLSLGTTTVNASADEDALVESIQGFVDALNESVSAINSQTGINGTLKNDGTIRTISTYLLTNAFSQVAGVTGDLNSLVSIGISTGSSFDAGTVMQLSLDKDKFLEAYRDDPEAVMNVFHNTGDTGIADVMFNYVDELTKTTGYLNSRVKTSGSIDEQIKNYQRQIDQMEERLTQKETRLRQQFTRLETMSANFQSQSSALAGIASGVGLL